MSTTFKSAAESYARAKGLYRGTRNEYLSTIRKWERWGGGGPIEQLRRKDVRDFLDWVHEEAVQDEGTNPGGAPSTRLASTCAPSSPGPGSRS